MSLYIAFFPGLGLEVQHWHGKASGAALLGGEPGFSAGRWNGLAKPVGRELLWVGGRRGRPTPSGHRKNFTHDSMVVSLWFGAEKMHFPVRKRSVPLSSGGTNSLQRVLGLPATASSPPPPPSPHKSVNYASLSS